MTQPNELKTGFPMELAGGVISTTTKVWAVLLASKNGDLNAVKKMIAGSPELIYAQYNYTPPIHFAVREGHVELVNYLLQNGAHDPAYRIYPFQENLQTIAADRNYLEIKTLLDRYAVSGQQNHYKGDNGKIHFPRNELQLEFERAVDNNNLKTVEKVLQNHPAFAKDETYFWGEGILTFAVKENHRDMINLLMKYGARVPDILKWTPAYYFERFDGSSYIMQKGMNPNTKSWQEVTILHNMAQKGFIDRTELLLSYGADINPIDDEYRSTPLGMAARWGQTEMVQFLIAKGADVNKAGANWSRPLVWAQKKGHAEIEQILLKAGAERL